jgi:hypothetical protein
MWAVVEPDGRVEFREDASTDLRKVFGGYKPEQIDVDEDLGATVWISSNAESRKLEANFPMTALLAGKITGWTPMLGRVVILGSDGQLPVDLFEKLKVLQQRYVAA